MDDNIELTEAAIEAEESLIGAILIESTDGTRKVAGQATRENRLELQQRGTGSFQGAGSPGTGRLYHY